jgi:hypothetical protein
MSHGKRTIASSTSNAPAAQPIRDPIRAAQLPVPVIRAGVPAKNAERRDGPLRRTGDHAGLMLR